MRELAEEFGEQFECSGENMAKYITFSVPIKRENENGKAIAYKIKFINSVRFMSSSLLSLVGNLAKGLHKGKRKNCKADLEYMTVNGGALVFKCVNCKKNYDEEFDEHLRKRLENNYRFCDGDTKNFVWRCLSISVLGLLAKTQ